MDKIQLNGTKWTKKIFLGTRKSDNARIYLSAPSWECGWYWGFGYLGNKYEHYHLNGYANGRNINMYDALQTDYILNPEIAHSLWKFCELVLSAYRAKKAAEFLGRGGAHITTNVCKDIILNKEESDRLNVVVLPAIFDALYVIFYPFAEKINLIRTIRKHKTRNIKIFCMKTYVKFTCVKAVTNRNT